MNSPKKKAFDIVMEDRKKIVEKIIENMEKGEMIFSKKWNSEMLLPQNPTSKLNYKGGNRIRLMMKAVENEYKDPRWVTFKQAQKEGWNVKKGEKGVLCEKWIFTKIETKIDEEGKEIKEEVKLPNPVANYFYVFNAEQIENIPKLEIKQNTNEETDKIIEGFINSSEVKIKEIAQDKAYYDPTKDEIILPIRESFKSQQDFAATTFHEMVHSTGHKDRLKRDMSGKYGSEKYAKEELVAELGSVFLQSSLGVKLEGEHFDNHTAYLQSWIKVLKNDPQELFRAANAAEKASDRLFEIYKEKELSQNTPKEILNEKKDYKDLKEIIKENSGISKDELLKFSKMSNKELNDEIGELIKKRELFYSNNRGEINYFNNKKELEEYNKKEAERKEYLRERREKELKDIIKEISNSNKPPRGNYNALTGNEIITIDHTSGDKRWLMAEDVRNNNISIKENEKSFLTVMTHKEEGKLYVKPIEYYNVSQLKITKEIEQKFKPIKERTIDKSKEKGRGIGD